MSSFVFHTQACLIASVSLLLLRNLHRLIRVQVVCWFIGVTLIAYKFGISGQLTFYSNDQVQYVETVSQLSAGVLSPDLDSWLTGYRLPFTLPATVLAIGGVENSLALKTTALFYLVLVTDRCFTIMDCSDVRSGLRVIYLSASSAVGVWFSVLALRETAMMYFTITFFTIRSPTKRALALLLLYQLRPHLAAAIFVGFSLCALASNLLRNRGPSGFRNLGILIAGPLLGHGLYTIGVWEASGTLAVITRHWNLDEVMRVSSNFFGLQFITASPDTVTLSIKSLLASRLLFSETILIPTLATISYLLLPRQFGIKSHMVMLSFATYVGLVTNTDFNSFRQNLPFMPVLGLLIMFSLDMSDEGFDRDEVVAPVSD